MCTPSKIWTPAFGMSGVFFTGQSRDGGVGGSAPGVFTTPSGPAMKQFDPTDLYTSAASIRNVPAVGPLRTTVVTGAWPDNISGDAGECYLMEQLNAFAVGVGGDPFPLTPINCAISNSTIVQRSLGGSTNSYASLLTQIGTTKTTMARLGLGFGVPFGRQQQGEADQTNINFATQWLAYWTQANTDIKAITGQSQDIFIVGEMPNNANRMVSQQQILAATLANPTKLFCTQPNYYRPYAVDGQHAPDAATYGSIARKDAQAMWAVLTTGSWKPLRPFSVTRSGSTVTVVLEGNIGNIVIDGTLAPNHQTVNTEWALACGFEYYDSVGNIQLSAPTITGSNSLTLSIIGRLPNPDATFGYAWTADVTSGNHGGTTNGQRGLIHDSDTTVLLGGAQPNWLITFAFSLP